MPTGRAGSRSRTACAAPLRRRDSSPGTRARRRGGRDTAFFVATDARPVQPGAEAQLERRPARAAVDHELGGHLFGHGQVALAAEVERRELDLPLVAVPRRGEVSPVSGRTWSPPSQGRRALLRRCRRVSTREKPAGVRTRAASITEIWARLEATPAALCSRQRPAFIVGGALGPLLAGHAFEKLSASSSLGTVRMFSAAISAAFGHPPASTRAAAASRVVGGSPVLDIRPEKHPMGPRGSVR